MTFIYGGDTGMSYDDLMRRRKVAESLQRQGQNTPKNTGEGIHAIARAMVQRNLKKKNTKALEDNPQLSAMVNVQGMHDVAGKNPSREVIQALMGGAPNYARGGIHGGGQAVVGENGPEVVNLPPGAVITPGYLADIERLRAMGIEPLPPAKAGEERDYFAPGQAPEFQEYDPASQERLRAPGADTGPAPIDPRELIGPESRFDDAAAYRTADSGQIAKDALPYGDGKLTGDQSKSIAYYRRGYGANQTLSDPKLAEALTQYSDTFAGNFGAIGRKFQDADFQVAKRAASEFLAAILRKDTGAAITNEEFRLYGPMYLPQPGDKPELLAAKAKAREEALVAIEMGLGTAAPLAVTAREELAPQEAPDLSTLSDEDLLRALTGGE